ncbi:MAG: hypothetical protein HRS57_00480 [Mycoplasmataceae bacterium]|nr:hypothetical protein [Mycoplasmataceae bacterium]
MSSSLLATLIIDSVILVGIIYLFVRSYFHTGISRVRYMYLFTLVLTFASISLASSFRTQMVLDEFNFSYATFAFIGTLVAYPLGQSLKIFFGTYTSRNQNRKEVISILLFLSGIIDISLFVVTVVSNNYDLVAIFSVIASFALGFISGLFGMYVTIFSNMNENSKLFRNVALIAVVPFIGTLISTIPQSIIIVSGNLYSLTYQNISYLWLLSGFFALAACVTNQVFTVDWYGKKRSMFVPTEETKKKSINNWKNLKWVDYDSEYTKPGIRVGILGFFFLLSYTLCTGTLAPQYILVLNNESNELGSEAISVFKAYLPFMLSFGSIIGTIFGYRYLLSKTNSDNLVINLAFVAMITYIAINLINAYTVKSPLLMFVSYLIMGYAYGVIYFYFLTIAIKLTTKVSTKLPIGMFYLFLTTMGSLVANVIASIVLSLSATNLDNLELIYIISIAMSLLSLIIYNFNHASITKEVKSSKHWGYVLETGIDELVYINPFRKQTELSDIQKKYDEKVKKEKASKKHHRKTK